MKPTASLGACFLATVASSIPTRHALEARSPTYPPYSSAYYYHAVPMPHAAPAPLPYELAPPHYTPEEREEFYGYRFLMGHAIPPAGVHGRPIRIKDPTVPDHWGPFRTDLHYLPREMFSRKPVNRPPVYAIVQEHPALTAPAMAPQHPPLPPHPMMPPQHPPWTAPPNPYPQHNPYATAPRPHQHPPMPSPYPHYPVVYHG